MGFNIVVRIKLGKYTFILRSVGNKINVQNLLKSLNELNKNH